MDVTFFINFIVLTFITFFVMIVRTEIKATEKRMVALIEKQKELSSKVKMQSMIIDRMNAIPKVDVEYAPNAFLLERAHGIEDLCYDVRISEDYVIKEGRQILPTGIKMRPPKGYHAILCPTSGNSVKGMECWGEVEKVRVDADTLLGIIDQGYRQIVGVMFKSQKEGVGKTIKRGTKVGQMWFVKADEVELNKVNRIDADSSRGMNGFGSGHKS